MNFGKMGEKFVNRTVVQMWSVSWRRRGWKKQINYLIIESQQEQIKEGCTWIIMNREQYCREGMEVAVLIIRVSKTTQGTAKIIFIPVDEHFKVLHTIIPL